MSNQRVPVYWARDLHGETRVVEEADHLAAVEEAALRAYKRGLALARGEAIEHYQQGAADERARIRKAVEAALPPAWGLATVLAVIDNEEER